jgi:GTPase SAR1 family protein
MEKETEISNILNIAFLGLTASGKSSIINRLVNRSFYEVYNPTLLKTYDFFNSSRSYKYEYDFVHPSENQISQINLLQYINVNLEFDD